MIAWRAMETAEFTIQGADKPDNQDASAIEEDLGLLIVADGVTHCDGGGIASQTAVERFVRFMSGQERIVRHSLRSALSSAQDALLKDKRALYTTFDAVVVQEDRLLHIHAGDSRIYLIRRDRIERLTVDQVDGRYLANALGIPRMKAAARSTPRTDDIIGVVLMTDGVWGELEDPQIDALIHSNGSAQQRAAALRETLRDPPPADDATCVIALF